MELDLSYLKFWEPGAVPCQSPDLGAGLTYQITRFFRCAEILLADFETIPAILNTSTIKH